MQTNLLWSGREYHSIENCLVTIDTDGADIRSVIVGSYESKIYHIEYRIKTNMNWETVFAEIKSRHSNIEEEILLQSDAKGNWTHNGVKAPLFDGCIDVDIPLTPFTNTLPINRLRLSKGREEKIKVVYIDLLQGQITSVVQKYSCLEARHYHYENVPNDFEATILVDEQGLVIDYPELFVRTAIAESHYRTSP